MEPRPTKLLAVTFVIVAIILLFLQPRERDPAVTEAERERVEKMRPDSRSAGPNARPPERRNPRPEKLESGARETGADDLEKWLLGLKGDARTLAEAHATVGLLNRDPGLIRKALEMDPNNPLLLYLGTAYGHFSGEERLAMAERFLRRDPDNAMAAYLYAAHLFKSGDAEKGLEILGGAERRRRMDDYSARLGILFEEAYAGAGASREMAKLQSVSNLGLPYLSDLCSMVSSLNDMARASAPEQAAPIDALSASMGKRLGERAGSGTFVERIAGLMLEERTLAGLPGDALSPYGGLTVAEARESIAAERANLKESTESIPDLETLLPGNTLLIHGYVDRFRTFGEAEAVEWLRVREQTEGDDE